MDIAVGGRRRGRGSCELKGTLGMYFVLLGFEGIRSSYFAHVDSPIRLLFSFAESPHQAHLSSLLYSMRYRGRLGYPKL